MNGGASALSKRVRTIPADLFGIVVLVALASLSIFVPVLNESPLRMLTGILFILFVPGYALMAALFPEAGESPTATDTRSQNISNRLRPNQEMETADRGVDTFERLALSFVLSLTLVPLLAMVVTLSPLAFQMTWVFTLISSFVLVCTVIAAIRRQAVPVERRFSVPIAKWVAEKRRISIGSPRGVLLNLAVAAAVIFALGTLGFAILSPHDGEQFTEFYVLSEDDDGEPVAAEYPDSLSHNDPEQLLVGIENYEQQTVEYDVIVQLQRINESATEATVTDRVEVDRFSVELEHNETQTTERELTVPETLSGEDFRVVFLLYKDAAPENPTADTAHRDLHIWVDVADSDD